MSGLNSSYNPKNVEEKWYTFWETNGLFRSDVKSNKKPFCIVIPPPNVTGELHMGHALVNTLQDIMIRFKRMQGFDALWIPGTDHAGIATQSVVEKHLIAKYKKRRKDFSREEFLKHVWEWKEEKEKNILNQLRKLGFSLDWDHLRFTMDENYSKAVFKVFKKMFDDKLIYKGDYLVNWDPITETALSDDEVEYEEIDSHLWYFKYFLEDNSGYITVATTRPETMLGDVAVAISKNDKRYFKYLNKNVILPIVNRKIPIIEDSFVDQSFGSGAVKITPGHDFNDYEVALRHNLPMINIMNSNGTINENGKLFQNISMQKARTLVVDKMKELNLLEKVEPYKLKVGHSYRSKAKIEPYLSKQWFVKTTPFKKNLIETVKTKKVKIIPDSFEKVYFHWIDNLRDWCISRQLWWGHRIPVWYNKKDTSIMICSDSDKAPEEIQNDLENWERDPDVLDTWFSSSLWPFSTLGWPENSLELKKYYPTSLLITGYDILFFWVARMILMGEYVLKDVPFHETFLHGLIYGKSYYKINNDGSATYVSKEEKKELDKSEILPKGIKSKWEKMSKSKGNIIDPIEIINDFGTDALRIALTSSVTNSRQIDLDIRKFEEFKNFSNKIWNAAKFVLQNLEENKDKKLNKLTKEDIYIKLDFKNLNLEDAWILNRLNQTIKDQISYFENKNFDKAALNPYDFFWNDFCAYYLEISKPFLYGNISAEKRVIKQKILLFILFASIRLMHPIAPFITEEIFSLIKNLFPNLDENKQLDPLSKDFIESFNKQACIVSNYPKEFSIDELSIEKFEILKTIIHIIRNIRNELKIPLDKKVDIFIISNNMDKDLKILKNNDLILKTLSKVNNINYVSDEKSRVKIGSFAMFRNIKIFMPLPEELIEIEIQRLQKEKIKLEKQFETFKSKLEDENFLSKAPQNIIDQMKNSFIETKNQLSEINSKLKN